MKKKIYLSYEKKEYEKKLKRRKIINWMKKIFKELNIKKSSCSIFFTGIDTIISLNYHYFKKNAATDVISFSQLEGEKTDFINSNFLGDIAICVPYADKQSKERKHSIDLEIFYLLLHGLLHLLGYDHKHYINEKMIDLQNKIFLKLTGVNFG